jgi:hypothetical protein
MTSVRYIPNLRTLCYITIIKKSMRDKLEPFALADIINQEHEILLWNKIHVVPRAFLRSFSVYF